MSRRAAEEANAASPFVVSACESCDPYGIACGAPARQP